MVFVIYMLSTLLVWCLWFCHGSCGLHSECDFIMRVVVCLQRLSLFCCSCVYANRAYVFLVAVCMRSVLKY